jgi:membrane protein YqaA with SNARE-associated domain
MLLEMALFTICSMSFWQQIQEMFSGLYATVVEYGGPALLLVALADSSFLSIPEGNDILIIALSTGQSWDLMSYYVTMTIIGSVLGCTLLYSVGRRGGDFVKRRLSEERRNEMRRLYDRWGIWTLLVPAVLPPPTPFKIFVLSAGLFRIPPGRFIVLISLGRSIRYFMWGILAVLYGEAAKQVLQEEMKTVGVILFLSLVAVLTAIVLIRRRNRKKAFSGEAT